MTKDINSDVSRVKRLNVKFRGKPKTSGPIAAIVFEDTCGNLINLVQPMA